MKSLKHPLDEFDEDHKASMEIRAEKVSRVFGVASKLFEILCESGLTHGDRATALQLLQILHHRIDSA